jgi:hypothetical protein
MVDVSGIPNLGIPGMGASAPIFADQMGPQGAAAGYGGMTADQINQSFGMGPGGAGDFNQAVTNNLYGGGQNAGFGSLTDYYSSLGASYGRATGGFGGTPGRVGTIGNPGTSNPGYLDSASYNPFVAGAAPIQHYGGLGGNQVFDNARYLEQNPDVWKSGTTPWEHYNQYGRQEGRQAPWSNIFDADFYKSVNPDVARAGVDPTAHWAQFGLQEGRAGQTFAPQQYLAQNRDVWAAGADPWQHYSQYGKNEGRQGAWNTFDTAGYFEQNPDVKAAGVDPMAHWYQFGAKEGRDANIFDADSYRAKNPDVWQAGADPYQHYLMFGRGEGREGSWTDAFNAYKYQQLNPDVAASGMDPTAHWYQYGQQEGRKGDWGGQLSPLNSYQGTGYDAFDPSIYEMGFPSPGTLGLQPSAATQQSWDDLWNSRGPYNRSPQSNNDRDDLAAEYYAANRDVYDAAVRSGQDPTTFAMNHIMAHGQDEGRTFFDPFKYGQENPDVLAAGMDPTAHWFQYGSKEKRNAPQSSVFSGDTYRLLNPDVAAAGVDPLQHWLNYGQNENRMGGAFESGLMYDQFPGTTYRDPWIASIPEARRTAETVNAVKALSQKYGWDPAAYAAVVQMETQDTPQDLWNPTAHNKYGYWGLSQMGENSFTDQRDSRLGGMTWQQYQRATPAQQVAMYGAWLDKYARPDNAAGLVRGGIGSLPVEDQAAIMMGTQFGPNKTEWVRALAEGNMDVPTSTKQAEELKPWTINAMRDALAAQMAKWPQQQSPWPLN